MLPFQRNKIDISVSITTGDLYLVDPHIDSIIETESSRAATVRQIWQTSNPQERPYEDAEGL